MALRTRSVGMYIGRGGDGDHVMVFCTTTSGGEMAVLAGGWVAVLAAVRVAVFAAVWVTVFAGWGMAVAVWDWIAVSNRRGIAWNARGEMAAFNGCAILTACGVGGTTLTVTGRSPGETTSISTSLLMLPLGGTGRWQRTTTLLGVPSTLSMSSYSSGGYFRAAAMTFKMFMSTSSCRGVSAYKERKCWSSSASRSSAALESVIVDYNMAN